MKYEHFTLGDVRALRSALGISVTEAVALIALHSSDARMKMSALGARIDLSRAAVTALVDRLDERGLANREKDEFDRRVIWVELRTPALDALERVLYGRRPRA